METNPADLVRSGYNALSRHYRGDDDTAPGYDRWLTDLHNRLPGHSQVLDIGCGCGIPAARQLTTAGHQVTGVDISDVQIERARQLVPAATFIRADATELDFPPGSFHAVICLYALIHMPLTAATHCSGHAFPPAPSQQDPQARRPSHSHQAIRARSTETILASAANHYTPPKPPRGQRVSSKIARPGHSITTGYF